MSSRLLTAVFAFAGLVLVVFLIAAGQSRIANLVAKRAPVPAVQVKSENEVPKPSHIEKVKADRAIKPRQFVPPFGRHLTELERLPARPPLTPPKPKEKVEGLLLPRPVADAPGILTFPQGKITLEGLKPLSAGRVCGGKADHWPCGQMALTALRRLLHGRSVFCHITDTDWHGDIHTRCDLGDQDIAAWLAQNGWAEGEKGSAYAEMSSKAKQEKLGLYGSDPR